MTHPVYDLSSRIVDRLAALRPEKATYYGLLGYDHLWADHSVAGWEERRDALAAMRSELDALPPAGDRWARLAGRVAADHLDSEIAWVDTGEHLRDLNSIDSGLQDIRDTFDHMDYGREGAWSDAASRMEGLPDAMTGYRERLEQGRSRGMAAARRQVVEAAGQAGAVATSSLLTGLASRAAEAGSEDAARRLEDAAAPAQAAFADLARYLRETYLADAPEADAVGEERYSRLSARFLGTTLDLAETYQWGWSEVERLRDRIARTAAEIDSTATLEDVVHTLQTDPAHAAATAEQFREIMAARQQVALDALDGRHFEVPPSMKQVEVRLADPSGSLGAWYVGPSEDFSRPGVIWWRLGRSEGIPLFDQISTAYHEGFPGHHLQVGLQLAAADHISRLQKVMVWMSGAGEGWALYAEDLMEELGYLEKPEYRLGKLSAEMLRAVRVVIDIGSHLQLPIPTGQPFHPGKPWTFERGTEMLVSYALLPPAEAASEMNRYLGWAGQAISYKVGQRAIRDLRAAASAAADFAVKDFHARVLELGAIGLDVLRAEMAS